jgi:two-component system, NarL family, sensor histidine kinase UhpB
MLIPHSTEIAATRDRPPLFDEDANEPRPDLLNRLARLPIIYKVLVANVTIVVIGALGGTYLTIRTVQPHPDTSFPELAAAFAVVGFVFSLIVNLLVLRAAFRPLSALQRAAQAVRGGDFSVRADLPAQSDPQVAELANTLNATLDELERDRIHLRSLASQVIHAQEDERRRLSRELHDDTAQVLFAQLLRLSALKSFPDTGVQSLAASLEQLTSEALESVRRLALELRPPALDDLGLVAALGDLTQRFSEASDIPVDYEYRGPRGRLPSEVELVLYRVAQEALTNTVKHGEAHHIWIDLDRGTDDVTLSVRDDGKGFDPGNVISSDGRGLGLGMFGMEERVALVNGRFRVWSSPGQGAEIFSYVPIAR